MELLFSKIETQKVKILFALSFKDKKLITHQIKDKTGTRFYSPSRMKEFLHSLKNRLKETEKITLYDGEVTCTKRLADLFSKYTDNEFKNKTEILSLKELNDNYSHFLEKFTKFLQKLENYDAAEIKGFLTDFFKNPPQSDEEIYQKQVNLYGLDEAENWEELDFFKDQTLIITRKESEIQREIRIVENEFQKAMAWFSASPDIEIQNQQLSQTREELFELYQFFEDQKKLLDGVSIPDFTSESNQKVQTLRTYGIRVSKILLKGKQYQENLEKFKLTQNIKEKRDPMTKELFDLLMSEPFDKGNVKKRFNSSRLRISFGLLYFTGMRANEISLLTYEQIMTFITQQKLIVTLYKTNKQHSLVLGSRAKAYLEKEISEDLNFVFKTCKAENLLSTFPRKRIWVRPENEPFWVRDDETGIEVQKFRKKYSETVDTRELRNKQLAFIKLLNTAIIEIADSYKLKGNYKSHSFRINRINQLLRVYTLEQTAFKIGHKKVDSTYLYYRNLETFDESIEKLNKIDFD